METEHKVVGRCLYCKELIAKNGMTRHLSTHFKKMEKENKDNLSLHLVVSEGDYFLHLLMDSKKTLRTLDIFLRNIWLECCEHASVFRVTVHGRYFEPEEVAAAVFEEKKKFTHAYDYGTTTTLNIAMKNSYAIPVKGIELISRNEPLPILCYACKTEPAAELCTVHRYNYRSVFFCKECGAKHAKECEEFAEYARRPIANSPRTGMCAYRGGYIDTERDGVFQKK